MRWRVMVLSRACGDKRLKRLVGRTATQPHQKIDSLPALTFYLTFYSPPTESRHSDAAYAMTDVLILAAGRGERLRPLTDSTPKPLLQVGSKTLLEHHLHKLKAQGFRDVVINLAWLGAHIRAHVGAGERFGLRVRYSDEPHGALESGGGIVQALRQLRSDPFVVLNGDILCDFNYASLQMATADDMHLVLVPNPPHHPAGDFGLAGGRLVKLAPAAANCAPTPTQSGWTYAGIGCFRRRVFAHRKPTRGTLSPIIERAIADNLASAEVYRGQWLDVGSAERLAYARQQAAQAQAQAATD